MSAALPDIAWHLLTGALASYRDQPRAAAAVRRELERFEEPLRIAVAGPPGAGKTTLLGELAARRGVIFAEAPTIPVPDADALLYLTPHPGESVAYELADAQVSALARATPVDTIVVLSRADEFGGGRVDGLGSARMIARRYQRHVALQQVCQAVVAASARIGYAGRTLTAPEHAALTSLASRTREETERYLLSVARFVDPQAPVPVDPAVRAGLVERLGLPGVRLALTLLRTGSATRDELSGQLVARSGLDDPRDAIGELFIEWRRVLKARSALIALDALVRAQPHPDGARLLAALDRALTNGHELRELRLLAGLRAGRTRLPPPDREEAVRLIGGTGPGLAARLGGELTAEQAWAAAADAVDRWRAHAVDPRHRQDHRRAAGVVVRSCEGILAKLRAG